MLDNFKFTLGTMGQTIYTAIKTANHEGDIQMYFVSWLWGNEFKSQLNDIAEVEDYVARGIWVLVEE